jgi:SAM-dependent methyltransferase
MTALPPAESMTHQHLAAVINSECGGTRDIVRILDAGCGDGRTISFLHRTLRALQPDVQWELHGFDVLDEGVQTDPTFLDRARERLRGEDAGVEWNQRIAGFRSAEQWPYSDEYFDVVISNQVLEHLVDLERFMSETARTLRHGGISVHIFPLRRVVWEGHVRTPFVHRLNSHDVAARLLELSNRCGVGRFGTYNHSGDSLQTFALKEADRLWYSTRYRHAREVLGSARNVGLRASFRYTPQFYEAKIRSLLGRPASFRYHSRPLVEGVSAQVLQFVSSVTLFLHKENAVSSRQWFGEQPPL